MSSDPVVLPLLISTSNFLNPDGKRLILLKINLIMLLNLQIEVFNPIGNKLVFDLPVDTLGNLISQVLINKFRSLVFDEIQLWKHTLYKVVAIFELVVIDTHQFFVLFQLWLYLLVKDTQCQVQKHVLVDFSFIW